MDPEAHVDKGESARFSSFMGAIAIADLVKTTLGPKGMDKILQSVSNPSGDIMVTNDGATILRSIVVDNPAAKVLIDIAKTQDDEVGDGTTSVTVLAGELLREAEKLIQLRIHPMVIIDGWRRASAVARAALEASSLDHGADPVAFRADLMNIARTSESRMQLGPVSRAPLLAPARRHVCSPRLPHRRPHRPPARSLPRARPVLLRTLQR